MYRYIIMLYIFRQMLEIRSSFGEQILNVVQQFCVVIALCVYFTFKKWWLFFAALLVILITNAGVILIYMVSKKVYATILYYVYVPSICSQRFFR